MSDGLSDANRKPDYTRDPVFGTCNACGHTHCRCAQDRIDELEKDNRFLSDEAHKIAYELRDQLEAFAIDAEHARDRIAGLETDLAAERRLWKSLWDHIETFSHTDKWSKHDILDLMKDLEVKADETLMVHVQEDGHG